MAHRAAAGPLSVGGRIVERAVPAVGSGVLSAWVELAVKEGGAGSVRRLYLQYFGADQRVPVVNHDYVLRYRIGLVRGLVGAGTGEVPDAWIVESFDERVLAEPGP